MGLTYMRQILEKLNKIECVCAEFAAEKKVLRADVYAFMFVQSQRANAQKVREALAVVKPKVRFLVVHLLCCCWSI